jgi:hypothetical protein
MLDELFKAAAAIEHAGISAKDWHPKFKPLPKATTKAPCVRVWLDSEGHIVDLEPLSAKHAAKLRKFEPDNGKSFPGFNVRPLFIRTLPEAEAKKFVKDAADKLKASPFDWASILVETSDLWAKDTIKTVERVLTTISADLKEKCGDLQEEEPLSRLFSTVSKMTARQFQAEYGEILKGKVAEGKLPLATLLFLGAEGKETKTSIFLDVKDYKDVPVAHEQTIARLNDLLLADGNAGGASCSASSAHPDAYGVDAAGSENPRMAQVVVPVLGGVFLRSQSSAIPAQSRYDLCEGATFTVGDTTRANAKRALEWLSKPERNGQTYGIAGDKELLFAYPAQLPPDSCPELALLLGAQSDDARKFADLAKCVIGQLKGAGGEAAKDAGLEIFSLRKMDKARTKVVYYRNTTVASLEAASRAWEEGFKNIPPLDIRVWGEGKNDKGNSFPIPVEPQTLFPVKFHKILNVVWTLSRNEVKQSKVKLFEPSTGLRLLLDAPASAQTAYVAERFLAHSQTYFIALCRTKGRNEIADRKDLPNLETYPGLLGLLLYKLGKTKESYMNESAFQLGRFLRVADEIHRLYCEVVRPSEKMPELCGSSLLNPMLESPLRAFNQLTIRVTPYLKWVKRFHGEEKSGLAHYWMHQWATIADTLHQTNWFARPTPEERAQIFLGYLSSFPKSEKPEASTGTTEPEGTQQ